MRSNVAIVASSYSGGRNVELTRDDLPTAPTGSNVRRARPCRLAVRNVRAHPRWVELGVGLADHHVRSAWREFEFQAARNGNGSESPGIATDDARPTPSDFPWGGESIVIPG